MRACGFTEPSRTLDYRSRNFLRNTVVSHLPLLPGFARLQPGCADKHASLQTDTYRSVLEITTLTFMVRNLDGILLLSETLGTSENDTKD